MITAIYIGTYHKHFPVSLQRVKPTKLIKLQSSTALLEEEEQNQIKQQSQLPTGEDWILFQCHTKLLQTEFKRGGALYNELTYGMKKLQGGAVFNP